MTSAYDQPLSLDLGEGLTIADQLAEPIPETPYSDVPSHPDAAFDFWRSIMDRRVYHEPTRSRGTADWEQSMPAEQRSAYDSWTNRMARERITPSQLSTRSERNRRYEARHKAERASRNAARLANQTGGG